MRYRVNWGNGQVDYPGDRRACEAYARQSGDGYAFVQFQDRQSGEWFSVRWLDRK